MWEDLTQIWGGFCAGVGDRCCLDAQHPHPVFGSGSEMSDEQCRGGVGRSPGSACPESPGVSASLVGRYDVSTASGSATLVYQVDCTGGIVTVSAIDITTSGGLASLTAGLAAGAPVKVYGIPQADGTLKAYVLAYFTGQAPAQ